MNSINSAFGIEISLPNLKKKLVIIGCLLIQLRGLPSTAGSKDFTTLSDVIRHFEVAFVDKPNLMGLLVGGLYGLKRYAPEVQLSLRVDPDLFTIQVGKSSAQIKLQAVQSFRMLEKALVSAAAMVIDQLPSVNPIKLQHYMSRHLVENCGDPWSVFIDAELYPRLLDDGTRQTGSLGMLVERFELGLRVLDLEPHGVATQAGIRIGDRIDNIAERSAKTLNELEALALMRGKPGEQIRLVVEGKLYKLSMRPESKRNLIVDEPRSGIARVHILNFRSGTARRLSSVMKKLNAMTRLKGLILDLRGNPGGLVEEATDLVGLFINPGTVVSVINRKQMRTEVERSQTPGAYRKLPMVVLVDHRSASVSEIVAMALRDHQRAKLVGEKTLGKGTVQVVMELKHGAALKLSIGRYYSPNGTPLYEGIEPDVECLWNHVGEDRQLRVARELLQSQI